MTGQRYGDIVEAWYIACTLVGSESAVAEELRAQGYAVFLPLDRVRSRRHRPHSDAVVTAWSDRAHYPGYVFVGRRVGQPESVAPMLATPGVRSLLTRCEDFFVVPHRAIDRLMMLADADGYVRRLDRPLKKGARVRLNDPFENLRALVEVDAGKSVSILLECFGAERRVVVPPEAIADFA